MAVNRRLVGLAAGHLVLGIIAGLLVFIELPGIFLVYVLRMLLSGLADCQVFLLAVWGASSTGSPWGRMAWLVAGAVYLEALYSSIFGPGITWMSTVTLTMTMAALLVVRALGVSLTRFDGRSQPAPPKTEGLRFSIRGLMIVTAAVALLSAGARALGEAPAHVVLRTVVWAMCSVAVGLVALWAALGVGRPLWRGPVVFALSLVLGAYFAFALGDDPVLWGEILLSMLLYSTLLFGSLLVLRSCGYRFVRREVSSSKLPDGGSGSLSLEIPASGVTAPE